MRKGRELLWRILLFDWKTNRGGACILYPMVSKVPDNIRCLKRKEKVMALSAFARESARASAVKSGLLIDEFNKDGQGVPIPMNGVFWSVSHKQDVVAGVVSRQNIGIDIEKIKPVSDALFEKIVTPDECLKFKSQDRQAIFFRTFTAKETVLKITAQGLRGLSKTKIEAVIDEKNLMVCYQDKKYRVENFYFDGYLAAVTKDLCDVQWTVG